MVCARGVFAFAVVVLALLCVGCAQQPVQQPAGEKELVAYPANDLEGVVASSAVELDPEVSSDGGGSLKISVSEPTTVALYETGDLDVENARLIYRAKVRSADVEGPRPRFLDHLATHLC